MWECGVAAAVMPKEGQSGDVGMGVCTNSLRAFAFEGHVQHDVFVCVLFVFSSMLGRGACFLSAFCSVLSSSPFRTDEPSLLTSLSGVSLFRDCMVPLTVKPIGPPPGEKLTALSPVADLCVCGIYLCVVFSSAALT